MSDVDRRWANYLRRTFNVSGGRGASLLEDIFPTVNLNEESAHSFHARDERLFSLVFQAAAGGAGTYATAVVSNPAGRERLLVVDEVAVNKGTAAHVRARILAATSGSALYGNLYESRWSSGIGAGIVQSGYLVATSTPAALDSWITDRYALSAGIFGPRYKSRWVVAPGYGFQLQNETANELFDAILVCYDIPLHGGETG